MDFKIMTTPFGETYYFNHNLKLKQLRKDEQNTGADSKIFEFLQ